MLFAIVFPVPHAVPFAVLFNHVFVIGVLHSNLKPYFLGLLAVLSLFFTHVAKSCRVGH